MSICLRSQLTWSTTSPAGRSSYMFSRGIEPLPLTSWEKPATPPRGYHQKCARANVSRRNTLPSTSRQLQGSRYSRYIRIRAICQVMDLGGFGRDRTWVSSCGIFNGWKQSLLGIRHRQTRIEPINRPDTFERFPKLCFPQLRTAADTYIGANACVVLASMSGHSRRRAANR